MVGPALLSCVLEYAHARGIHLPTLLRGLDICAADFDEAATLITQREAVTVLRRLSRLLPATRLGLLLGQGARITERGILALGQLAAATLGDAISLSVRFAHNAGHLLQVREEPLPGGRRFVVEPFACDHDLQGLLVDLTFSASVQLRRQLTLANYAPASIELVSAAPAEADAYAAYFGCPVSFGCARNAINTEADWLGFPLPWANVMASRLSLQLLDQETARLSSMSALGFTVERAIRRGLPAIADVAQVAKSLHISERTLRRQLAQAGLSFRQLLDESRKSRAFDLMTAGSRPISDIAALTGFADSRAFARAFKRWAGHSPTEFRGQLRAASQHPASG